MIKWSMKFHRKLADAGVPFYAFCYKRDMERQARLYAQGRRDSGPVVTRAKAGQSPHNYGVAVDEIHATRGWDLTKKEWEIIGAIGKEIARKMNLKLVWGGDWGWDYAHWELADWRLYKAAHEEFEAINGRSPNGNDWLVLDEDVKEWRREKD